MFDKWCHYRIFQVFSKVIFAFPASYGTGTISSDLFFCSPAFCRCIGGTLWQHYRSIFYQCRDWHVAVQSTKYVLLPLSSCFFFLLLCSYHLSPFFLLSSTHFQLAVLKASWKIVGGHGDLSRSRSEFNTKYLMARKALASKFK